MFGTVLTTAITLMHIYVFWRAASVPFVKKFIPLPLLVLSGILLWLLFYIGRFYGHGGNGPLAHALELSGMDWMASLFLISVCLLVFDILTGFGFIMPAVAPSLRGLGLAAGVALSLLAVIQGARPPVIKEYEVRLPGLPDSLDGTVVAAMSDLHVGTLIGERWLNRRIAQVQAQKPDLVVLLGDLFEGHGPYGDEPYRAFDGISAPLGVWAVPGNHEYYGRQDAAALASGWKNFRMLNNSNVEIRPGLILAGVDYYSSHNGSRRSGEALSFALSDRPEGATILLSHAPVQAEKAAAAGVGLMLSGHTHGGQIWPFGYLVRIEYPLLAGEYRVDGMTAIVCRGTGSWGPRMRLWHPGEILRITLRAG